MSALCLPQIPKKLQRAVFCNVARATKWLKGITSNTIIRHKSLLHISIIPSVRNALRRDKHGFKVACMQNLGYLHRFLMLHNIYFDFEIKTNL